MSDHAIKKHQGGTLTTAIEFFSTATGIFAGYSMLLVAFIMVFEIIMRWLSSPTTWVLEVSSYIQIWFGFIAAAYGLKEGSHINVDILVYRLSPRTRNALEVIGYALCFVFSLLLLIYSWDMLAGATAIDERSSTVLRAPMFLVYLGMVIGGALLSVQSLVIFFNRAKLAAGRTLETGKGLLNNTAFIIPVFLVLLTVGVWLYTFSPGAGIVVTLAVLLLIGVPVFTSLGLVGSLGLFLLLGADLGLPQIGMVGIKSLDSFTLLAIPLYILAGQILMVGGLGRELFALCSRWVGHFPGGATVATIMACAIFAAISGSSVATAATIGIIAIPEMLKRGYDPRQAYGVVAAGGTLGILIPPSAVMIIYSNITGESTGALFIGGVLPGIVLAAIFAGFAVIWCMKSGKYEKVEPASWPERFKAIKDSVWSLLAPVIIIGGIYTGIFTPTEAAAVTVIYALVVALLRGKLRLRESNEVIADGTRNSTMILMIVVSAMILGTVITLLQIPQHVCNFVGSLAIPVWVIMLLLCLVYVVLGMFLEVVSIMMITMPIVYPLIISLGINGIWFGVFITLLMEMALISPPVGLNLYVIQGAAKAPLEDVLRGVWPYMLLIVLGLILLALVPDLALWLPGTMGFAGAR